ncbi:MAG: hypothetical protein VZQ83_03645 [Eubacterium sp.]|nr:hypothetical protein [Eubacterium sp.]
MDAQSAMELFAKELMAYDSHVGQNDMFYYSLPYERNYELTNSIPLAPTSGNVIKFYQYRVDKPVIIFTDVVDTSAEEIAAEYNDEFPEEYEEGFEGEEKMLDENGEPRELSEDEMAALLTADQEESFDEESDEEVYDKAPASAAPVDDYDDDEVYDKEPTSASAETWEAPEF